MKYAIITGGGGGMGYATALRLKNEGYVVFVLDQYAPPAEENIYPIAADVTKGESLTAAVDYVKSITDSIDAIVHFAGIYKLNSLVEIDEQEFLRIFDVNLFGAYRVNKAFVPLLKRGGRVIITTSELAPLSPLPFTGLYAVTKGALDKYAHSLAMELQLLGISVSVIRAGAVDTGMIGASTAALDKFCTSTTLYKCNASRFKRIVDKVEARKIPPQKIANLTYKILCKRRPRNVYSINRNPLLRLLNILPARLQRGIIRNILK